MSPDVDAAPGRPPVRAVVFDLDGTLVQTRIASWEIFERINARFGLGVDEPEAYFDLFRGNVYASIAELCRDETQAAEVKEAFLHLLRTEYTPPLVPGVTDVVRRLAGDCTLAVMSSNAMQVMRRVLTANDLAFCFAHVFGGDVTPDKRTAMRTFLADSGSGFGRRCAADYDEGGARDAPDPAGTVLVTDTAGDVRDALEVGIRVVGVAWGMHSVEKLTEAGAEFVALWPQEITAHLLGDAASLPPGGTCAPPPFGGSPAPAAAVAAAAGVRRDRRRVAAAAAGPPRRDAPEAAAPPATAADELLSAIRRVCAHG
ncbi:MAG: HAD hydrolase-like protein [Pseudonocardia sp.]|nr:HAD hydrolase-like protein [Pseudonocardia sp.]